jgi:hypothetical protein
MKTVCSLLTKFSSLIAWFHSCFDRVIFKGHLPISQPAAFERFVDYVLKIRRTDFLKVRGPQWSERLVVHSKSSPKRPAYSLQSVLATVYHALGIDPALTFNDPSGRRSTCSTSGNS